MKFIVLLTAVVAILSLNSFKGEKSSKVKVKAAATTHICGSVIDEVTGETLVGVEVALEGTDLKTYTDFDGNFTFDNVKVGTYKMVAKLVSYSEIKGEEVIASANGENTVHVRMKTVN
ncbi:MULTISPECIES: carboxypeptidase-like regulatory domain-containing protein [unclassified Saccharicrinis]|uniref:carboxypeptidase-like regulatory domain-containing protein n=1 Tax=unclassified Saccharicrinis TaxID=2646859 RepID=UPI003D34D7B4